MFKKIKEKLKQRKQRKIDESKWEFWKTIPLKKDRYYKGGIYTDKFDGSIYLNERIKGAKMLADGVEFKIDYNAIKEGKLVII